MSFVIPPMRVAVCGAGAMGSGIAMVAALAGANVAVFDVDPQALARARERVDGDLHRMAEKGRVADVAEVNARFDWISDVDSLGTRELVIEAVIEDLEVKRSLLRSVEEVVGVDAVVATNTSSIPVARLAAGLARPDRFIGMHFFNPASVMRLVEVVPGPATDAAVVAYVESVSRSWGKSPVRVADVPGFIVNRVARPFYAEGFCALQEGIAPGLIDHLFRSGAGFRMGPLELSDLIGQDVNFAVARSVYDAYFGQTRFVPQRAQAALVDAGRLGRKSGGGVFDYTKGASTAPSVTADWAVSGDRTIGDLRLGELLVDDAEIAIRVTRGSSAIAETRLAGRPVAIIDWCAPAGTAVGFAANDDIASLAGQRIAGLGLSPHRLPDRPGLMVARTLAQIANAAMDALLERVSDDRGIDQALRFGANYPFGPLEWAADQGRDVVAKLLDAIARSTGQQIYTPSEQWSR